MRLGGRQQLVLKGNHTGGPQQRWYDENKRVAGL